MTKQAQRRSRRIDAILESAVAAFRARGYHGTSMEQIADQLLMTKGSLYYYFRDKEEILFAVHDRALDLVLVEVARVRRMKACPCEKLSELLAAHIRIMVEGFYGTGLAIEFGTLSPARLRRVVAKRDRYEGTVRALLVQGARKGCLRRVDPKMAGMAMLGAINWIARWYRPGGPAGAGEMARDFLDLFMGGLHPRGAAWEKARRRAPGKVPERGRQGSRAPHPRRRP